MPIEKNFTKFNKLCHCRQQYCIKRLFYVISIGPAAFSLFMSSILKPIKRQNKCMRYLDDVFIQETTAGTMLQTLDKYHQIKETKNLKAAPDKSFLFLEPTKFLGHQV